MIKVFGMPSCPDCAYIKPQLDDRFEYMDIGSDVHILKQFLILRDTNPAFTGVRRMGKAGIPCFVREDGTVSLDPAEFGLKENPQQGACNLDGTGNC